MPIRKTGRSGPFSPIALAAHRASVRAGLHRPTRHDRRRPGEEDRAGPSVATRPATGFALAPRARAVWSPTPAGPSDQGRAGNVGCRPTGRVWSPLAFVMAAAPRQRFMGRRLAAWRPALYTGFARDFRRPAGAHRPGYGRWVFPNESRLLRAAVHAGAFSGNDGAREAPFFRRLTRPQADSA